MKKNIIIIGAIAFISAINIFATSNNYPKSTEKQKSGEDTLIVIDTLKEHNNAEKNLNTNVVKVSWYGDQFHGRKTANGERFDMNKLSAAHKKLPFGTKVRITNLINGKSVVVVINDRGPYVKNREFDLSKAAFKQINSSGAGVIKVKYEIIS